MTCANDVTARDLQRSDNQWTRGKGFDTFCPLGPWIVTGLSEGEVGDLGVRCRVNGDLRQEARTSQMVFSPAFLISYITQVMTLEPGDVVLTGTPAGVGPLHPGDEVAVEIERVGTLTNRSSLEPQEFRNFWNSEFGISRPRRPTIDLERLGRTVGTRPEESTSKRSARKAIPNS